MKPAVYARAHDVADALARAGAPESKYLGGGTNLVDLMHERIARGDSAGLFVIQTGPTGSRVKCHPSPWFRSLLARTPDGVSPK